MPAQHLRQPAFTYSACVPLTKNKGRTQEIHDIFVKTNYNLLQKCFGKTSLSKHLHCKVCCVHFYQTFLIRSTAQLLITTSVMVYIKVNHFPDFRKCPLPFSFQLKIAPSLPPPAECCSGWFKKRFLLSQQVRKIKSNIEYRGKRGEKTKYS